MTQWILTSGLLIAAVLLIRAVGRDKLSARVRYALWALVLVRLLVPFSIGESALSVQNWLPETQSAQVQTEPVLIDELIETPQHNTVMDMPVIPITETESHRTDLALPGLIWLAGSLVVGTVFLVSNLRFAMRLRRSRKEVMHRFVPIYVTDAVETPCLFGVLKPAIYITPEVWSDETVLQHAMAHELTHYRHKDHVWSVLRCVCVSLHWFNPLVWMAAFISQKDAEMACDEGALLQLGEQERTGYAKTLMELTCVGYKGMLTAATSMTGSDSDLKQRILRIVKNPKMSVAAAAIVLVIAILVSLAVFTAAKAPAIEGVWRMELSYLGVGVDEPASAYMEYEFYGGCGKLISYSGDELFSAETYRYTIDGDTIEIVFGNNVRTETFQWAREGDTLILGKKSREMTLTRVEREKKPYLLDGYNDIYNLTLYSPNEEQYAGLNETQCAQLLELLRKGEVTETRREVADNIPYMVNLVLTNGEQQLYITIANDLVYTDNKEVGYVLSNIDEIEYWLQTLKWNGRSVQVSGFVPEELQGITFAQMAFPDRNCPADPAKLAFLEELLTTAEPIGYAPACPFNSLLELTLADGRVLGISPALDSCATFRIEDEYYKYGSQFATDDEGSYDNTELLAVFGLTPAMLEDIIISNMQPVEGAVIGTNADVGDVVRILNDVMEPAFLSIDGLKTMQSLLWLGLGDAIGEEEVAWDEVYYSIINSDLPSKEDVVFLSDNGSLYMDGVRYELSTADELLEQLDAIFNEFRITQRGQPLIAVREAVGATVYLELRGVPEDAEVVWTSEDETVCAVSGDAYGCTINVVGGGVSNVRAEWTDGETVKSDTITVYCE